MTDTLKIAIELAFCSVAVAFICNRLNRPYPWNSTILDSIEGLSVLVFLPSAFFAIIRGIWLL